MVALAIDSLGGRLPHPGVTSDRFSLCLPHTARTAKE